MKSDRRLAPARAGDLVRRLGREKWTALAVVVTFILAVGVVLAATQSGSFFWSDNSSAVTVGTPAQRDYVVERDFPYVDAGATEIKRDAREKLVPAVFVLNDSVTRDALLSYDRLVQSFSRWQAEALSPAIIYQNVQADFPGRLDQPGRPCASALQRFLAAAGRRPQPDRGGPFAWGRGPGAVS